MHPKPTETQGETRPAILSLATRRALLEGRLIELGARLGAISVDLDAAHNPDLEDLATGRQLDEALEGTAKARVVEIAQIRAALARVADGTYGRCRQCGDPIPESRLDAAPWTPLCRKCAR